MRHQELTRDQRLAIITLRQAGLTYQAISDHFSRQNQSISIRQIQLAVTAGHPTPQKKQKCGQKSPVTEEDLDELEAYVTSCKKHRFLSYPALSETFDYSVDMIQRALSRRGYKRYLVRQKPPLTKKNRDLCLT